jgi:Flp pilus assembly pilin Flp
MGRLLTFVHPAREVREPKVNQSFHVNKGQTRMTLFNQLWKDQSGAIISAELILVMTIVILGMVVGLTTLRDQVVQELGDVAIAIGHLNQSVSFSGATGHHSSTAGSIFIDLLDDCDGCDSHNCEPACINICDVCVTLEGCT